MRLASVLVLVVSLVVVQEASSQRDYSVCSQMVSDAAHNVGVSTASDDYKDSIFENSCEQDGSVKSSHVDFSVVAKVIPIQFNQGNDEQTVRTFCKTFSQDVKSRTDKFDYNSQVVDSSLKTAVQCVDIITKGGTGSSIAHRFLGADTLAVSVTSGSGQSVEIQGLQPGVNTRCISPGRLISTNWDINTTHKVNANDGTYTIVCTRTATPRPDLGPSVQFFNRTNIIMGTNLGSYDVFWPDQHVEPERDAEKIAANITALQNQVSQLQQQVKTFERTVKALDPASVTTSGTNDVPPHGDATLSCPPGMYFTAVGQHFDGNGFAKLTGLCATATTPAPK
jgi:hypothetical protein